MGRKNKATDYTPHRMAFIRAFDIGGDELKKYLRNSSSAYISKPKVREAVFADKTQCEACGSTNELQIDHIVPVANANRENIYFINSIENLRVICGYCNRTRGFEDTA